MIYIYSVIIMLFIGYNYYDNIIWNGIKLYSLLDKNIKKYKKICTNYFVEYENNYIFILDGKEIKKCLDEDITNMIDINYDMVLYKKRLTDNKKGNEEYYLIRYNNIEDINKTSIISNIKIHNPSINLDNNIYKIELNYYNYLIVNNILFDRIFMKWWLLKYNNYKLEDDEEYNILFFDDNMFIQNISDKESLLIEENKYSIKKNK